MRLRLTPPVAPRQNLGVRASEPSFQPRGFVPARFDTGPLPEPPEIGFRLTPHDPAADGDCVLLAATNVLAEAGIMSRTEARDALRGSVLDRSGGVATCQYGPLFNRLGMQSIYVSGAAKPLRETVQHVTQQQGKTPQPFIIGTHWSMSHMAAVILGDNRYRKPVLLDAWDSRTFKGEPSRWNEAWILPRPRGRSTSRR